MALSVEKLLNEAHTLIVHLKDRDSLADNIISTTQVLFNKFEAMKQYQDDITELNEIAKHRPRSTLVLGIAQENRQIRALQQENSELQATLEEHQSALELIMHKYREHTVRLLQGNKLQKTLQGRDDVNKDPSVCHLMDKMDEMAGVMQKAIEVDETTSCADKQRLSQLEVENKGLREMLEICSTSRERILMPPTDTKVSKEEAVEDDDEDETTDTECDSTVLAAPEKMTLPESEDKDTKTEKETPSAAAAVKDKDKDKEKEKEKEKNEKGKPTATTPADDKTKKKKSPESGRKATGSPALGGKSVGASKSAGDVRKGRTAAAASAAGKTDGAVGTSTVKKSASGTVVRKETGALSKSPSLDGKKTIKGKTPPRASLGTLTKK